MKVTCKNEPMNAIAPCSQFDGKTGGNVDFNDDNCVLDDAYRGLALLQLAPTDAELRRVSTALAQYDGVPLVTSRALEAFLETVDELACA